MSKPSSVRRRGKFIALVAFIIGIAILTWTGNWWPGVMLALGLPLALWQYLQGRRYDTWITLFVFVGAFITVQFEIKWEILLPILFTIGGIYVFIREWIHSRSAKEEEEKEDSDEISEDDD